MLPHNYVYSPDDLATLRRALVRVCELMGVATGGAEAELVADKLLLLFQAGATDVDQLVAGFSHLGGGVD